MHDHAHDHDDHGHAHGRIDPDADRRWLWIALGLIASFMVVEVVGGLVAGSLALLSDAAHMVTDAGALGLALVAASPRGAAGRAGRSRSAWAARRS